MKINLHMICHMITFPHKSVYGNRAGNFNLIGWRFYETQKEISDKYLYIVESDLLSQAVSKYPDDFFVCILDNSYLYSKSVAGNVLFIDDSNVSYQELEHQLAIIFETFQQWHDDIREMLLNKWNLQELLNIGARFLPNPIGLFDINGALLARTGDLGQHAEGTLWEDIDDIGFTPTDDGIDMEFFMMRMNMEKSPFFLRTTEGKFTSFSRIICPLHYEGNCFAYLGTQDYYEELTQFDRSIICILKPIMEFALRYSDSGATILDGNSFAIRTLLSGYTLAEEGVESLLEAWQRDKDDSYYVIVFKEGLSYRTEILNHIQHIMAEAKLHYFDGHIVAIYYGANLEENKELLTQLEIMAHRMDISIGASNMQKVITDLRVGYLQGLLAAEEQGKMRVCFFSDVYLSHLAKAINDSPYCSAILFPHFLEIMRVKKEGYDMSLISTLRQYILMNGNLSMTASALYIHRHTAEYRISKIEELLGICISELTEQERIQLYISCLWAEHEMTD